MYLWQEAAQAEGLLQVVTMTGRFGGGVPRKKKNTLALTGCAENFGNGGWVGAQQLGDGYAWFRVLASGQYGGTVATTRTEWLCRG